MEWAMSLLLEHLEAMKRALAEMDTNVGQVRFLDETDLPKPSYLQNIDNESLRLYPPVPLVLPHESSEDCTVGRFDVPRGTVLLINAGTIQWDPYHWVDPSKFMPERFGGECHEPGFSIHDRRGSKISF
ncbi:hypothetical protein Peur_023009 [Populus x canadensis]